MTAFDSRLILLISAEPLLIGRLCATCWVRYHREALLADAAAP
jgi:hypothetical protein